MSAENRIIKPRNFYLNEQHELSLDERDGGGGLRKYGFIDWASKGKQLDKSLSSTRDKIRGSSDPLRESRYFLLAQPDKKLTKKSEKQGQYSENQYTVNYAQEDSRVFSRLGLDLLQVNEDGTAIVHSKPEQFERALAIAKSLEKVGIREQYRWAPVGAFDVIPPQFRIDYDWVTKLSQKTPADAVVELQPLLTRTEIDTVLTAISSLLKKDQGERLNRAGTDFSGRQWWRGTILPTSLQKLANSFFSIQSLHSPLFSLAASSTNSPVKISGIKQLPNQTININNLPTVAVLDTGIPDDHKYLAAYKRGRFSQYGGGCYGNHGSLVASRVVFGDLDFSSFANVAKGTCRFYDAVVAENQSDIDDKRIIDAMRAIVSTAPDVRVFNFSFDSKLPLDSMLATLRAEKLRLVQDLDNFVFAHDVLVVIAAGNTERGLTPNPPYPNHLDDPQWALGHWARSFNSITCGSTVELATLGNGLVSNAGWPSPFTRLGPGLCDSPKPDFCNHGGNVTTGYTFATGLGVWGYTDSGEIEDHSGTSFAAPLLAREAAFVFQGLQRVCEQGARPFSVTVKAFLALTAIPPINAPNIDLLIKRALGRGYADSARLNNPHNNSAVLVWQGILESPKDIVRIQIPIPRTWINRAENPILRLILAWDSPVNAAVHDLWACRKITVHLKPNPEGESLRPNRKSPSYKSYPIIEREYYLKKNNISLHGDAWVLEISYDQIADYYPGIDFTPEQRIAFAAELIDKGTNSVSPQSAIQGLSVAATMNRLSLSRTIVRAPVLLKTPL